MAKNLGVMLKHGGLKPIIEEIISAKRSEESEKAVSKYILDKENFEKNTRLDRVFGPDYFLGYAIG